MVWTGGEIMIEVISDHKLTNADRIKSLNDEELAEFLFDFQVSLCKPENIKSTIGFLQWLQQPAE